MPTQNFNDIYLIEKPPFMSKLLYNLIIDKITSKHYLKFCLCINTVSGYIGTACAAHPGE